MAHRLPREGRILRVFAAAVLFGGLFLGLNAQRADAAPFPSYTMTINPCVSLYTGQVTHTWSDCPAGTYALDSQSRSKTLCASYYTKKFTYRYSGQCAASEFAVEVGGKSDVWGCVNTWTGSVGYLAHPQAQCSGMALPFAYYNGCLSNSQAADKPAWAPAC